jgi:hypothetical protein
VFNVQWAIWRPRRHSASVPKGRLSYEKPRRHIAPSKGLEKEILSSKLRSVVTASVDIEPSFDGFHMDQEMIGCSALFWRDLLIEPAYILVVGIGKNGCVVRLVALKKSLAENRVGPRQMFFTFEYLRQVVLAKLSL